MTCVRSAVPLLVAVLLLTGCAGTDEAPLAPAVASGSPDTCTGEVVDVVVSVVQWGDVVRQVGGDCATVTTIVSGQRGFEPAAADLAAVRAADLVVVDGAGSDAWATRATGSRGRDPAVFRVADLDDAPRPARPHLWFDPGAVQAVAPALADALSTLSPDAADVYAANAATWQAGLLEYLDAVAALRSTAAGRTYAASGPVVDRMCAALGLVDATPSGYRRSVRHGAAADLTVFEDRLADGTVDVLVVDPGTDEAVTGPLRAAAELAGVPVVEVTESPGDDSFVSWQLAQLGALDEALRGES